ncbi:MAG: SWIM zinc finger family protein [Myxococcota bacterium]
MRDDLLALSPELLAQLYNPGLVKRAEREIAAGQGPALEESPDGTLAARFPDATQVLLAPAQDLAKASCSCGASAMCRHRIALALSYLQKTPQTQAPAPIDFDDASLAALGQAAISAARAAAERGVMASVDRSLPSGVLVRLPTSTVLFPTPQLSMARCDCAAKGACEHLVLAAWALRVAKDAAPVELPGRKTTLEIDRGLLGELLGLVDAILERGAAYLGSSFAERFSRLEVRVKDAGLVWIHGVLEELWRLVEGYSARSARYDEARLLALLTELGARVRAARAQGELPLSFSVGLGEASETLLERVRLVSLGARVDGDGRTRSAEVYLADPAAGTVNVILQRWTYAEDQPLEDGPALAARTLAPRLDLGTLARGSLVSAAAKRRANLEVVLGTRPGQTTLLPGADLSALGRPLVHRSFAELRAQLVARPPAFLRPRRLADAMVVLEFAALESLHFDAAAQRAEARVRGADDEEARITVEHRPLSPYGIDAFLLALEDGARTISGHARLDGGQVCLDAVAVQGKSGLLVLDLASKPNRAPTTVEPGTWRDASDPLTPSLRAAGHLLAEFAHHGLTRLPRDFSARLERGAAELELAGLVGLGGKLRAIQDREAPGTRWLSAAIHLALAGF